MRMRQDNHIRTGFTPSADQACSAERTARAEHAATSVASCHRIAGLWVTGHLCKELVQPDASLSGEYCSFPRRAETTDHKAVLQDLLAPASLTASIFGRAALSKITLQTRSNRTPSSTLQQPVRQQKATAA